MSEIPRFMKAMEIVERSGSFQLLQTTRAVPDPDPSDVVIKVYGAGVNGHDVHQLKKGGHALRPDETDIPGLEVSGVIVRVGSEVNRWKIGDEVSALLRGGGYAEYAKTPEGNCLPKPRALSWAEAAVLPETFFTVWSNVFVDCALAPEESLLMNGGTSGIGVAAIQIASVLGHRVFATARGPEKVKICQDLGAEAIDYERESFPDAIKEATGGRGVDVILDIVAGDYLGKDIAALAKGGRVVFIGGARGWECTFDLREVVMRQARIHGSLLRPRSDSFKAEVARELEEKVWQHVKSGRIKPMLHCKFPLSQAQEAIRMLDERRHVGKVALEVTAGDQGA